MPRPDSTLQRTAPGIRARAAALRWQLGVLSLLVALPLSAPAQGTSPQGSPATSSTTPATAAPTQAPGAAAPSASAPTPPPASAMALPSSIEVESLSLKREEGAALLSFGLRVQLSSAAEEALRRGVPLYFNAQVALYRPRWYWLDARVSRVNRSWRLSFQPLTETFRVSMGGLNQNFATLPEALATITRLSRWVVADAGQAEGDERYYAEFSWRLDTSQLPRPLLLGLGTAADWALGVDRTVKLEP